MSNFAVAVVATSTSGAQLAVGSDNADRMVHVHVIGSTADFVGLGFTETEVDTPGEGFLLYGGANAGGAASTASFALPNGTELWVGPSVGSIVRVGILVTEA